eukprot:1150802-Pelagomonas_calceolata.AAC.5
MSGTRHSCTLPSPQARASKQQPGIQVRQLTAPPGTLACCRLKLSTPSSEHCTHASCPCSKSLGGACVALAEKMPSGPIGLYGAAEPKSQVAVAAAVGAARKDALMSACVPAHVVSVARCPM